MTPDHYAILGVAPTAEPAVIRAAYLALMREYHPDRNRNAAAVERAQAIGAAYKVLGDFDRRQEYDWARRRSREAAATALAVGPKRRLPAGVGIAGLIGIAAIGAMLMRPSPGAPPDRLPDVAVAVSTPVPAQPKPQAAAARKEKMVVDPIVRPPPEPTAVSPVRPEGLKPPPRVVEVAAVEAPRPPLKVAVVRVRALPKVAAVSVRPPPKVTAEVVAIPLKPAIKLAPSPPSTDLAALDQFVMHFYGQSWRVGDSRKRNALEQARTQFVVRRAGCAAESCKRSEYLRLQREVSAIVESGGQQR